MLRWMLLLASLLPLAARAAEPQTVVIDLKAADARTMAAMFSGEHKDPYEVLGQAAVNFTLNALQQIAQLPSPGRELVLPPRGVSAAQSLSTNVQNLSHLLPEGIAAPPTAVPNRNALLVTGTPAGIDSFRELLALLDVPAIMVNIALRLDEVSGTVARRLTPEMHTWGLRANLDLGGPAGGGSQLAYALPHALLLAGLDFGTGSGKGMTEAQVTCTSGQPALIAVGEVRPWFSGNVYYDPFGGRHVEYIPHAAFAGVTFWVLPQVIGDNAVQMQISADFSEFAGPAPNVRAGEISVHQLLETTVTVADGQPMVIGGLRRYLDEANLRWPGSTSGQRTDTDSIISVTPRIIRPLER